VFTSLKNPFLVDDLMFVVCYNCIVTTVLIQVYRYYETHFHVETAEKYSPEKSFGFFIFILNNPGFKRQ